MARNSSRSRGPSRKYWMMTINNPENHGITHDIVFETLKKHCIFFIFQMEQATTPHFQCFFKLEERDRDLSWLQRNLFIQAHYDPRPRTCKKKDILDCINYCRKTDTRTAGPWTYGQLPSGQGSRTDIHDLHAAVRQGRSDKYLFDNHSVAMYKYFKGVRVYRALRGPIQRKKLRRSYVFFGKTRTGKTTCAQAWGGQSIYPYPAAKGFWFPDYNGEKTVIVNEFTGNWPLNLTKQLLDPLIDCYAPVKGIHCWWCPDVVIFTTNSLDPESDWWKDHDQSERDGFWSRIHGLIRFTRNQPPCEIKAYDPINPQPFYRNQDWVEPDIPFIET